MCYGMCYAPPNALPTLTGPEKWRRRFSHCKARSGLIAIAIASGDGKATLYVLRLVQVG